MAITISTDPGYYGHCTGEEAARIARYIARRADEYIAAHDLDVEVRVVDSTGGAPYHGADEERVHDYIAANWVDWLGDALDGEGGAS